MDSKGQTTGDLIGINEYHVWECSSGDTYKWYGGYLVLTENKEGIFDTLMLGWDTTPTIKNIKEAIISKEGEKR